MANSIVQTKIPTRFRIFLREFTFLLPMYWKKWQPGTRSKNPGELPLAPPIKLLVFLLAISDLKSGRKTEVCIYRTFWKLRNTFHSYTEKKLKKHLFGHRKLLLSNACIESWCLVLKPCDSLQTLKHIWKSTIKHLWVFSPAENWWKKKRLNRKYHLKNYHIRQTTWRLFVFFEPWFKKRTP